MTTKRLLTGAAALVALVLAPVVIGRFGDELAGFLRIEVLMGFGIVATLVAINILESNNAARCRQPGRVKTRQSRPSSADVATFVPSWRDEDQKAA